MGVQEGGGAGVSNDWCIITLIQHLSADSLFFFFLYHLLNTSRSNKETEIKSKSVVYYFGMPQVISLRVFMTDGAMLRVG